MSKFAEPKGKLVSEFYISEYMLKARVEILQPYNDRVYNPCCGSDEMFVQLAKFIENHGGNIDKISVYA
ncbi:N-6 DNA methylase [Negativibacillus massiliensis]|uniref:N-6 DNA methylase n=1 Tax=Negativibacillus massiliensis TaxID=1871035 RepID=UPI003AF244A6